VDGEERLGDGGGLDERQALRHAHGARGRHRDLLGVTAAGEQGHRAVAATPAVDAGPDLGDLAGALETENGGRTGRRRVLPLPLQQVGAVEGGGGDAEHELAVTRHRGGDFGDAEHALVARTVDHDGAHGRQASTVTGGFRYTAFRLRRDP
jgi:hypothetical protein